MLYVYRFLWPIRLGWLLSVVYIRRFIYKFLNVCPFDYTAVAGSGNVGPVNQVNHTSWVAVVTPTDRPKSVRNRCKIELFGGVVCVVTLPFWHFCWCRGFCHGTESDLFLFLFWWRFCVVTWDFGFFFGCMGFCHRTESDLFLFRSLSWCTFISTLYAISV